MVIWVQKWNVIIPKGNSIDLVIYDDKENSKSITHTQLFTTFMESWIEKKNT